MRRKVKERPIHRNLVLGVSGSIAAYKAAALSSLLVQDGYAVRVVMTEGAGHFISPLTFEAFTSHPVSQSVWDEQPGASRMGHIELGKWADLVVIAPATAHAIARLALGLGDDALGALALTTRAPLLIAPAMESGMFLHPATQQHLETLRSRGASIIGPVEGHLASGASGTGRMVEPAEIVRAINALLGAKTDFHGRHVLVTAGPTHEPIDPVRYLANRSSGKMGYALAEAARGRGATVTLISGPTALPPPPGLETIHIETAAQLRDALLARAAGAGVIIMAAAVADFRPSSPADAKIKREEGVTLPLTPNPDIAAEVATKAPNAIKVGFALETENLVEGARGKLRRKGQQLVVANLLSAEHNPFGSDTNQVVLVSEEDVIQLPEAPKREVAEKILDRVGQLLPPD